MSGIERYIKDHFGRRPKPTPVPVPTPPAPEPQPTPQPSGHGLTLPCTDTSVRPAIPNGWSIPRSIGPFGFPAPYGTRGWRLTAPDEPVRPVGYSYWRNSNAHAGMKSMLVFVSHYGSGPHLIEIDKASGAVWRRGPIFDRDYTGEGMYFHEAISDVLYYCEGSELRRRNVITRQDEIVFDSKNFVGGSYIWQMHSAGTVHAGTLRDSSDHPAGSLVYFEDRQQWRIYETEVSPYDECQLDKSGRFLIAKEGNDNRIIDLVTQEEVWIRNTNGALGHSDTGNEFMLGENDYHAKPGACESVSLLTEQRQLHYHTTDWNSGMGHVSLSASGNRAWLSNASDSPTPRANEVIWFPTTQSLQFTAVAPNLVANPSLRMSRKLEQEIRKMRPSVRRSASPLAAAYDAMPKGNCDVTGEYFLWTADPGDGRALWMVQR